MKTLEQSIAFNPSYREQWRQYYASMNSVELQQKLQTLISGLDVESRELCVSQAELVPYFFPHPLLKEIFISESSKQGILPQKTMLTLKEFGFFSDIQSKLDKMQRDLNLPVEPLPEMLLHSGLKYVPKEARALIKDKVVIDGGAFIGDTAKLFIDHYSPKRVFALEPEKKAFAILTSLVDSWGLRDKITPLNCLLSSVVGEEILWGEGVGASVIKKKSHGDLTSEKVNSVSIDALVAEHSIGSIGLIKLDIEGSEMAAIEGAVNTIIRDRPLLLISIYHTARDFFEIKPYLEEMKLNYKFLVRKITDDLMKELVLICLPKTLRGVDD